MGKRQEQRGVEWAPNIGQHCRRHSRARARSPHASCLVLLSLLRAGAAGARDNRERIVALAQANRASAQTADCSDRPHQMLEAPSIEPSAAASDSAACAGPTRRTRTGTNDWPGQHFSCATAAVQWRLRNGVSARLLRRIRGRGATQPRCIHARAARALAPSIIRECLRDLAAAGQGTNHPL